MKRRILAAAAAGLALLGAAAACTGNPGGGAAAGATTSTQGSPLGQGVGQGLAGRYDAASGLFQQVVASDPNNKLAWYNLGYISQVRNDPTTAMADYDKALAVDPNYTPAMYNEAILLEKSNVDAAIALYRKILTIDSNASTTHIRLGMLLDQKGDRVDARNEFNAAMGLDANPRGAVP